MAKRHFRELKRISREEGLINALKYDAKETKVAVAYGLGKMTLKEAGKEREERAKAIREGQDYTSRQRVNESVRQLGNDLTKRFKERFNYGLGDFLTQDINLRKIGATTGAVAGAIAPYIKMYSDCSNQGENPVSGLISTALFAGIAWPFTAFASLMGGGLGYAGGAAIDNVTGTMPSDNSRKNGCVVVTV